MVLFRRFQWVLVVEKRKTSPLNPPLGDLKRANFHLEISSFLDYFASRNSIGIFNRLFHDFSL